MVLLDWGMGYDTTSKGRTCNVLVPRPHPRARLTTRSVGAITCIESDGRLLYTRPRWLSSLASRRTRHFYRTSRLRSRVIITGYTAAHGSSNSQNHDIFYHACEVATPPRPACTISDKQVVPLGDIHRFGPLKTGSGASHTITYRSWLDRGRRHAAFLAQCFATPALRTAVARKLRKLAPP